MRRSLVRRMIRKPYKGDQVILADYSLLEKNGMSQHQVATVIAIYRNDLNNYYRVSLPGSFYTAWFAHNDLELLDQNASIPKPNEPQNNECCGSECPDCVWIQYWEEMNEWEALHKK
jgi:hypothetical protein